MFVQSISFLIVERFLFHLTPQCCASTYGNSLQRTWQKVCLQSVGNKSLRSNILASRSCKTNHNMPNFHNDTNVAFRAAEKATTLGWSCSSSARQDFGNFKTNLAQVVTSTYHFAQLHQCNFACRTGLACPVVFSFAGAKSAVIECDADFMLRHSWIIHCIRTFMVQHPCKGLMNYQASFATFVSATL